MKKFIDWIKKLYDDSQVGTIGSYHFIMRGEEE